MVFYRQDVYNSIRGVFKKFMARPWRRGDTRFIQCMRILQVNIRTLYQEKSFKIHLLFLHAILEVGYLQTLNILKLQKLQKLPHIIDLVKSTAVLFLQCVVRKLYRVVKRKHPKTTSAALIQITMTYYACIDQCFYRWNLGSPTLTCMLRNSVISSFSGFAGIVYYKDGVQE